MGSYCEFLYLERAVLTPELRLFVIQHKHEKLACSFKTLFQIPHGKGDRGGLNLKNQKHLVVTITTLLSIVC